MAERRRRPWWKPFGRYQSPPPSSSTPTRPLPPTPIYDWTAPTPVEFVSSLRTPEHANFKQALAELKEETMEKLQNYFVDAQYLNNDTEELRRECKTRINEWFSDLEKLIDENEQTFTEIYRVTTIRNGLITRAQADLDSLRGYFKRNSEGKMNVEHAIDDIILAYLYRTPPAEDIDMTTDVVPPLWRYERPLPEPPEVDLRDTDRDPAIHGNRAEFNGFVPLEGNEVNYSNAWVPPGPRGNRSEVV